MSISPGAQIGAFAVLGMIGQGGMGRVYRARDARLKRDVALKVLPDELAAQPDRVARFQREAEILAGLTHQHIAGLYGLEETDGVRALVMELVEGPTLADRLARGPVPVSEALSIAGQIVEALDYAHERGILHRDLKPANIKVTPDGRVKLLDFGLAKALAPPSGGAAALSPDASPTITSPAFTQAGTILGTAAYMAPEQVRGQPLDKRADIWAFGCVLYEMLTGTRAFPGETVSDTLAAVLKSEPDWTQLPSSLPAAVRELLHHCLERDRKARLRDIADARRALSELPARAFVLAAPHSTRLVAAATGGALAASLLTGAWYVSRPGSESAAGPVRRVIVQLPVPLPISTSGGGPTLAISPDGTAIAFSGREGEQNRLYVHRFVDGGTTVIRGPLNPASLAFSPDGAQVVFGVAGGVVPGGAVWRSAVDGGEAVGACTMPIGFAGTRGISWSEGGAIVFGSPAGLFAVPDSGGACQLLLTLEGSEARLLWPQMLPDRRGTLLTVSAVSDDADSASIVVVPAGTTERRVIVRGARAGRLTASGHLLFARGAQIFAAPFDLDRLVMTAEPVKVLDGIASGQFGGPLLDISDRGDLVYMRGGEVGSRLVWITRRGERTDAGAPRRSYIPPARLSPDARWVVVSIGTADHFPSLYSLETGTLTALYGQDSHLSAWSPDSRQVAFPAGGIAIKSLDSTANPEVVVAGPGGPSTWSPDGTVLVGSRRSGDGYELFAVRLKDGTVRTLLRSALPITDAQFSPDGRWLAYASNESGRIEIYVTDFPEARIKKAVSTDGGSSPGWARNGRELFYIRGTSMMAAAVRPGTSIEFDRPVRLFEGLEAVGNGVSQYSVAPDGRFLFVDQEDADRTNRSQLTLVLNWFEELNRLVPVP